MSSVTPAQPTQDRSDPDCEKLGRAIRRVRIERGLNQATVARRAGVNRLTVARMEKGANVMWGTLRGIAQALEVSVPRLVLLAGSDDPAVLTPADPSLPPTAASIGAGIRVVRGASQLTQDCLAEASGLGLSTVRSIERAERPPTWVTVCAFARGLGVPVSTLVKVAQGPIPDAFPVLTVRRRRKIRQGLDSRNVRLGNAIRRLRHARGLHSAALATNTGIHRTYVSEIELGDRKVGWVVLCKLAHDGLQVSVARLASESEASPHTKVLVTGKLPAVSPADPPGSDDLALVLKRLRTQRKQSRRALAVAAGLGQDTVTKIENGKRAPTWPVLCGLAVGLGLKVSTLIEAVEREHEARRGEGDSPAAVPLASGVG